MSPHVLGTPASAAGEEGRGSEILIRTVDRDQERKRKGAARLHDRTQKIWQNFKEWQNGHESVANRLR